MKRLLNWFRHERPDPCDRCVRCATLRRIADMREIGEDDWVCRWCIR